MVRGPFAAWIVRNLIALAAALAIPRHESVAAMRTASPPATEPSSADAASVGSGRRTARWLWQHTSALPIFFYTPENHVGFGGGILTTWTSPDQHPQRPSSVLLALMHTTLRQTIGSLSHELRLRGERHILDAELRFIDWPDRYYGVGNDTQVIDEETFTDHYWQIEARYRYRLWRYLFVGAGHVLRWSATPDIVEGARLLQPEVTYGVGDLRWSATSQRVLWDSRDATFWPTKGLYVDIDHAWYLPALGSDFAARRTRIDARRYLTIDDGWVLAARIAMHRVSGDPPFQLLAQLGGSDLFRGWYLGRLRDRHLAAAEVEQRVVLTRRLGVVGFASLGRVAPSLADMRPSGLHSAMGIGARISIKKDLRANLRFDVAYGDVLYVYLQFREAF